MQNNIEQVESMSLGYTTLSAIDLKVTANDSNMASDQPGSHSSRFFRDMRFQVDTNIIPVSGLNELNQTLRSAWSSCSSRTGGSQDEGPLIGDTDSDRQTLGPKESVVSRDSLTEGSKTSRVDNLPTSFSNIQKCQNHPKGQFVALNIKFEEASQAAANKVHRGSSTKSLEEIQSLIKNEFQLLIKNEFWNISNSGGTRKRDSTDASLTEPAGSKRKTVACEYCPKKMLRECDLKYKALSVLRVRSAKGMTENIRSVILVPMAAPSKLVSRPLAVKMTGKDTKIRSIIRSKHGGVMNLALTGSSSVLRCFTGESHSNLISRTGIKSTTKNISASNSRDIRSGETGRRDFGAGFVRKS